MARILVFDSRAGNDSRGNPCLTVQRGGQVLQTFTDGFDVALSEDLAVATYPVRIHSPVADITIVDWEFYCAYFPTDATVMALRFYQEFFNDASNPTLPPGYGTLPAGEVYLNRTWPGMDRAAPWARELVAVSGGGGVITMTAGERRLALQKRGNDYDVVRAPLSVYGLWVRLALWVDIASSTSLDSPSQAWLKIYANVGGHDERDYLAQHGNTPYAYNAFVTT